MKKNIFFILLAALMSSTAAGYEDPVMRMGKKLHDEKCLNCHDTSVYSRQDHRVKTLQALSNQVNNCMKGPAKADWTVSETNSVIEYLNNKFYKF
ncbi:MAG: hypothetical protein OQL09_10110 [Gammaproteobacteria bacterium]|nr:hypothetical protein [Gammaproteobacteria bacterium]